MSEQKNEITSAENESGDFDFFSDAEKKKWMKDIQSRGPRKILLSTALPPSLQQVHEQPGTAAPSKSRVVFVDSGVGSYRAAMAAAYVQALHAAVMEAVACCVEPEAAQNNDKEQEELLLQSVLKEAQVDLSTVKRISFDSLNKQHPCEFDWVIGVSSQAKQAGGVFSLPNRPRGLKVLTFDWRDPMAEADKASTEEEKRAVFVECRDQVKDFVSSLPSLLEMAAEGCI